MLVRRGAANEFPESDERSEEEDTPLAMKEKQEKTDSPSLPLDPDDSLAALFWLHSATTASPDT